jgi:hypothetical protein
MSEYRIDIMQDASPHAVVLASEYFTARSLEAACRKGQVILARHFTATHADVREHAPGDARYGDLWVRDADGGNSAEFVDTIEVAS